MSTHHMLAIVFAVAAVIVAVGFTTVHLRLNSGSLRLRRDRSQAATETSES